MARLPIIALAVLQLASVGCRPAAERGGGAALIVLFPRPSDTTAFETVYTRDHMPMVTPANFTGLTRFVASRIVATPDGSAPQFYRVAELHFASLADLQAALAAPSARRVAAHADSISTGGRPLVFVADVTTR
jgi:uncharacterized protein (TIGR02118 family)